MKENQFSDKIELEGVRMKVSGIKNFYENNLKKPYKQIEYTGYAALVTTAGCLVKTKPRKLHKTFGILTGIFALAHLGLIKYYQSFRAVAQKDKN